jgi:hypothetical protein
MGGSGHRAVHENDTKEKWRGGTALRAGRRPSRSDRCRGPPTNASTPQPPVQSSRSWSMIRTSSRYRLAASVSVRAAACGVSRSTIPRWEPWQRYHLTLGNHTVVGVHAPRCRQWSSRSLKEGGREGARLRKGRTRDDPPGRPADQQHSRLTSRRSRKI